MNRVVAYLRVSTDRQENENQRYGFEKFCRKRDIEVTEWIEEKVSGTVKVKDRQLGEVLATLEKGDSIIFAEFSRIGRSVYSVFSSLQNCIEKGVAIYTIKENFTLTNDIHGKVMGVMLSLIADIERSLMAERVKETYQRKKREADCKDVKINWGRKLGRKTDMDKRKLDMHRDQIVALVKLGVPKTNIMVTFNTNRVTLNRYLKDLEVSA
jgi:DNA invertase Pin-like site-specific DNA recombinase